MGNQNSSVHQEGSTEMIPASEISSSEIPSSLHSASSSDSEPNNNLRFFHSQTETVVTQAMHYPSRHRKVPRVSRATSVSGGMRRKKMLSKLPGFSGFSTSGFMSGTLPNEVRETWQVILDAHDGDQTKIGLAIYSKIFNKVPKLREVFMIPEHIDDISKHEPFVRSASLLSSVIGLCVRNIDKLEAEMGPVIVMYGRRHYHRQKQGFNVCYVPLFSKCIIEYITESLGDMRTPNTDMAWQKLISYISNKLTEGVELERYRIERQSRKST